MKITDRQYHLLELLQNSEHSLTSRELCSLLKVSERTLRNEISQLNSLTEKKVIVSGNKGYRLACWPEQLREKENPQEIQNSIAVSLLRSDTVSVYDLAEMLYCSESTIFKYAGKLKDTFSAYHLKLVRKADTLSLQGDENSRRALLSHYFNRIISEQQSADFFSFDAQELKAMIHETLYSYGIHLDDVYFRNIVSVISVMLQRIMDGYPAEVLSDPCEISSLQKEIVDSLCRKIEGRFCVEIQDSEYDHMLYFLSGSLKATGAAANRSILENDDFILSIQKIIYKTLRHFDIPLSHAVLNENLYIHIYFMIRRMQLNNKFHNDISSGIRNSHPFLYDMAVYMAHLIQQEFDIEITEDETGLLTIYLGTNLSFTEGLRKARTVLLCQNYRNMAAVIEQQLLHQFGDEIEITEIFTEEPDSSVLSEYLPDLVISTYLPRQSVQSVRIDPLLSPSSLRKIRQAIEDYQFKEKEKIFAQSVLPCFDPRLFFCNEAETDGKAILKMITERMNQIGLCGNEFFDSVCKRESLASTAYFDRFALAHSLDQSTSRPIIAYYYSEKPIDWFGHSINLLLVLGSCGYDQEFAKIYDLLFEILTDFERFEQLIRCSDVSSLSGFIQDRL